VSTALALSAKPPSDRTVLDLGNAAPANHPAAALPVSPPPAPRRPRLLRRLLIVGLFLVLVAWAAYASYGLRSNRNHAESWRQRSLVLEEQANGMSRLLAARTSQLNVRIDQINRLAVKLRTNQDALARSEGDVGTLEARQRALANEKAQVEDERAALLRTAALYRICKDDLITLLNDVVNQDYASATYDVSVARASCGAADDSLGG